MRASKKLVVVTGVAALALGGLVPSGGLRAEAGDPAEDGGLRCVTSGSTVELEWFIEFFAPIGGWLIRRDGALLAELPPEAAHYTDKEVAGGEHTYELIALQLDAFMVPDEPAPIARCTVVVGDFGMECKADDRHVGLAWGPILIDVLITGFVVRRNGSVIATLPPEVLEYDDEVPGPGLYRYTVHAESGPDGVFVVGACTVRVPATGFVCTVDPPDVRIDWSDVPLPAIVLSHFVVVRDGAIIGTTRETNYVDAPGPGKHQYAVYGVTSPETDPAAVLDDSSRILVGECTVRLPMDVVPTPEDLRCVVLTMDLADPALPPAELGDEGPVPRTDVALTWKNPVGYGRILVFRNNLQIALLSGDAEQHVDYPPIWQGKILYEVVGVIDERRSEPAMCEVEIGPMFVPPPDDLHCEVASTVSTAAGDPNLSPEDGADDDTTRRVVVKLSWTNPIRYAALIVRRDGNLLAELEGDAMVFFDRTVGPGVHVYQLSGVDATRDASPAVACSVEVPPIPIPPVEDLSCVAVETVAQGPAAVLRWSNPIAYDRLLVLRNGEAVATLDGGAQNFADRGLAPGIYEYSVLGIAGNVRSPPAYCRVAVPGPGPLDLLYFSSGVFEPGNDAAGIDDVQAEPIDAGLWITSLAGNARPVQAWSFGVTHDPRYLQVAEVTIAGTVTSALNDGAGPEFLSIEQYREGVTMAAVIGLEDPSLVLPSDSSHRLLRLHYAAGPEGESGVRYPVRYSNALGDPPVAVLYVVEGFGVTPATAPGFILLPFPLNVVHFIRGDANGDLEVDMSDALHTLGWLYQGGTKPACLEAADANGSTEVDLADAVYTLQHLYIGGPPLPSPFPECGGAILELDCEEPMCPQPLAQ